MLTRSKRLLCSHRSQCSHIGQGGKSEWRESETRHVLLRSSRAFILLHAAVFYPPPFSLRTSFAKWIWRPGPNFGNIFPKLVQYRRMLLSIKTMKQRVLIKSESFSCAFFHSLDLSRVLHCHSSRKEPAWKSRRYLVNVTIDSISMPFAAILYSFICQYVFGWYGQIRKIYYDEIPEYIRSDKFTLTKWRFNI